MSLLLAAWVALRMAGPGVRVSDVVGRFSPKGIFCGLIIGPGALLISFSLLAALAKSSGSKGPGLFDGLQKEMGAWGIGFFLVAVVPFVEEFVFRGVILESFRSQWNNLAAVGCAALLFALMHYPIQMPTALIVGVACGMARVLTGSLWPAVAIHAASNLTAIRFVEIYGKPSVFLVIPGVAVLGLGFAMLWITREKSG